MNELPAQIEAAVESIAPAAALIDRRDAALLAEIVAGNRSAFDTLYRHYYARLTDFVSRPSA